MYESRAFASSVGDQPYECGVASSRAYYASVSFPSRSLEGMGIAETEALRKRGIDCPVFEDEFGLHHNGRTGFIRL
jgi:hypothetical protein